MQYLQIDRAKGATKLQWRAMTYMDSPAELPLLGSTAAEIFETLGFCREDFEGRHDAKTKETKLMVLSSQNKAEQEQNLPFHTCKHSAAICSSCR